jgi:hypothetical protein
MEIGYLSLNCLLGDFNIEYLIRDIFFFLENEIDSS